MSRLANTLPILLLATACTSPQYEDRSQVERQIVAGSLTTTVDHCLVSGSIVSGPLRDLATARWTGLMSKVNMPRPCVATTAT